MARGRRGWKVTEEDMLIKHYHSLTIQELKRLFPKRSDDSINAKIKRLKAEGKIKGSKGEETITRSLSQRSIET